MHERGHLWIGDWRLDPAIRSLTRADVEHRLEPKMVDVLLLLARHAGRPVAREVIERTVWSGAAVGTDLLNRTVWKLRRVLDDDAGSPSYIETIPRMGYRLVAPVADHPPAPRCPSAARAAPPPLRRLLWPALAGAGALAIGIVVATRGVQPTLPDVRIVPLTSTPAYEAAPSLSPDGRFVAFQRYDPAAANPGWDVSVLDLTTGDMRPLAHDGDVAEHAPAWAPAGDSIAYVRQSASACEVVVHPLSGEPSPVASCAPDQSHEVAWGPEGDLILSSSGSGQTLGLTRLHRDGRAPEPLTSPPAGYDGDVRPRVSPDGHHVAFVRRRTGGVSDLYVLEAAHGREPRQLTFDHRGIGGLAWTPDGAALVFSSTRGGNSQLWSVPARGGEPTVVPMSGKNASRITIGADSVVIYEEYFGDSDLWALDPATGATEPWSGSSRSEFAVAVSPDGRDVAFVSDRTGAAEVWIAPTAGGPARRLTHLDGAQLDPPRWSPDGRRLAFSAAMDGKFDVFVIDREGGAPRRVTRGAGDERAPAWWGGGLVFTANRTGTLELWATHEGGSEARRLTRGGAGPARPSPDGAALYFTRPDEPGLWRLDAPSASPERVVADVHPDDWANWTVTYDGLLYLRTSGQDIPRLERIDLTTGAVDTLLTIQAETPSQSGVAVMPDGRILYGRVVLSQSDLWIARGVIGR